jgi:DNA mismatch repair protein MutS2
MARREHDRGERKGSREGVQVTEVAGTPSSLPPTGGLETLRQIELPHALEVVSQHAVSPAGAERVRQRAPSAHVESIRDELATVAELVDVLAAGDAFRPLALPDIRSSLERLGVAGSVLEGAELAQIHRALCGMREIRNELTRLAPDAPRTAALGVELPPKQLEARLFAAVEPDGSVKDKASPELARVRKQLRSTREKLVRRLEELLRATASKDVAPEATITMRGGRYVMPIRREARSRVRGIVHGESGSGATLFVEPSEAVEFGNDLSRLEAEESRIVLKVLRELSEMARPHAGALEDGWNMCVSADDLYARARYAMEVQGVVPTVVPTPAAISIRGARHPLLLVELDVVVPFDLEISEDERVVVVSGPNTGGKTVLLKTVGLVAALAQSGVIPPVAEGTVLPVFAKIFSDIGDRQSIAESLSTFSGHLAAIKQILGEVDHHSLVLLDELGTGTDPVEGAALAGAVLGKLCERQGLTLATTHLNQLKELASETPGAVNASLQFDAERLAPTYRFQKGVPGRSYGLAIARRLGFPTDVLGSAEELQPEAHRSFDALLADLEVREREVTEQAEHLNLLESRLAAEQEGLEALRCELEERAAAVKHRENQLERIGRAEARRYLLDARKRVEAALEMARTAGEQGAVKEARRVLEAGIRQEGSALEKLEEAARKKGWTVRGRVVYAPEGEMTEALAPPKRISRRPRQQDAHHASDEMTDRAASQIDLRGMTADEAEEAAKRAVDDAVVAALGTLRIIHGKGTGALRQRVTEVLQQDPRVASYRTAPPQEGGWGATIVELAS